MPTGGFIAPGVIDNGDGTYRENDIVINPEKYWMSVCRNAPSMFIYDNSYVKCREITLSYTLPKAWLKNVVDGLTISFVARNPFIVWKNIPNIDPDSTTTIPPVWVWSMALCLHARATVSMSM